LRIYERPNGRRCWERPIGRTIGPPANSQMTARSPCGRRSLIGRASPSAGEAGPAGRALDMGRTSCWPCSPLRATLVGSRTPTRDPRGRRSIESASRSDANGQRQRRLVGLVSDRPRHTVLACADYYNVAPERPRTVRSQRVEELLRSLPSASRAATRYAVGWERACRVLTKTVAILESWPRRPRLRA